MTNEIVFILALIGGFYMAWSVGANDVSNAIGTSIGSGAMRFRKALALAAIFEFAGAFFVGSRVSNTIKGGIVLPEAFSAVPEMFALGMLASLLAAGVWIHAATCFGRPVSSTHAIIGAVLGFGLVAAGPNYIQWRQLLRIAGSWVISPLIGGLLGFAIYRGIRVFILNREHPLAQARAAVPIAATAVVFILAWSVFKNIALRAFSHYPHCQKISFCAAALTAILSGLLALLLIVKRKIKPNGTVADEYAIIERYFAKLQVISACYLAFAHGTNDVANAIGPIAGIVQALKGNVTSSAPIPVWALVFGGTGIVIGVITYGYKVIETVGRRITEITPTRGFAAELGTASTVLLCSMLGFPISTTFVLIGSLMGMAFARGFGVIDLKVIRNIFTSWLITIPASAVLAALFFLALKAI